eukprot:Rhum_TRINITY_DN15145_c13_g1::Rhum_TRINITY_DN15145_c13_g1_i1::g.138785::m.138785
MWGVPPPPPTSAAILLALCLATAVDGGSAPSSSAAAAPPASGERETRSVRVETLRGALVDGVAWVLGEPGERCTDVCLRSVLRPQDTRPPQPPADQTELSLRCTETAWPETRADFDAVVPLARYAALAGGGAIFKVRHYRPPPAFAPTTTSSSSSSSPNGVGEVWYRLFRIGAGGARTVTQAAKVSTRTDTSLCDDTIMGGLAAAPVAVPVPDAADPSTTLALCAWLAAARDWSQYADGAGQSLHDRCGVAPGLLQQRMCPCALADGDGVRVETLSVNNRTARVTRTPSTSGVAYSTQVADEAETGTVMWYAGGDLSALRAGAAASVASASTLLTDAYLVRSPPTSQVSGTRRVFLTAGRWMDFSPMGGPLTWAAGRPSESPPATNGTVGGATAEVAGVATNDLSVAALEAVYDRDRGFLGNILHVWGTGDPAVLRFTLNRNPRATRVRVDETPVEALKSYGSDVEAMPARLRLLVEAGRSAAALDPTLRVHSVHATRAAFAALLANGTVWTWGDKAVGGSMPFAVDTAVSLSANRESFSALLRNGSVAAWGNPAFYADAPTSANDDARVKTAVGLFANAGAHAVLRVQLGLRDRTPVRLSELRTFGVGTSGGRGLTAERASKIGASVDGPTIDECAAGYKPAATEGECQVMGSILLNEKRSNIPTLEEKGAPPGCYLADHVVAAKLLLPMPVFWNAYNPATDGACLGTVSVTSYNATHPPPATEVGEVLLDTATGLAECREACCSLASCEYASYVSNDDGEGLCVQSGTGAPRRVVPLLGYLHRETFVKPAFSQEFRRVCQQSFPAYTDTLGHMLSADVEGVFASENAFAAVRGVGNGTRGARVAVWPRYASASASDATPSFVALEEDNSDGSARLEAVHTTRDAFLLHTTRSTSVQEVVRAWARSGIDASSGATGSNATVVGAGAGTVLRTDTVHVVLQNSFAATVDPEADTGRVSLASSAVGARFVSLSGVGEADTPRIRGVRSTLLGGVSAALWGRRDSGHVLSSFSTGEVAVQNFYVGTGYACWWKHYEGEYVLFDSKTESEHNDVYTSGKRFGRDDCARICMETDGCTGIEHPPKIDDPAGQWEEYCAPWLRMACSTSRSKDYNKSGQMELYIAKKQLLVAHALSPDNMFLVRRDPSGVVPPDAAAAAAALQAPPGCADYVRRGSESIAPASVTHFAGAADEQACHDRCSAQHACLFSTFAQESVVVGATPPASHWTCSLYEEVYVEAPADDVVWYGQFHDFFSANVTTAAYLGDTRSTGFTSSCALKGLLYYGQTAALASFDLRYGNWVGLQSGDSEGGLGFVESANASSSAPLPAQRRSGNATRQTSRERLSADLGFHTSAEIPAMLAADGAATYQLPLLPTHYALTAGHAGARYSPASWEVFLRVAGDDDDTFLVSLKRTEVRERRTLSPSKPRLPWSTLPSDLGAVFAQHMADSDDFYRVCADAGNGTAASVSAAEKASYGALAARTGILGDRCRPAAFVLQVQALEIVETAAEVPKRADDAPLLPIDVLANAFHKVAGKGAVTCPSNDDRAGYVTEGIADENACAALCLAARLAGHKRECTGFVYTEHTTSSCELLFGKACARAAESGDGAIHFFIVAPTELHTVNPLYSTDKRDFGAQLPARPDVLLSEAAGETTVTSAAPSPLLSRRWVASADSLLVIETFQGAGSSYDNETLVQRSVRVGAAGLDNSEPVDGFGTSSPLGEVSVNGLNASGGGEATLRGGVGGRRSTAVLEHGTTGFDECVLPVCSGLDKAWPLPVEAAVLEETRQVCTDQAHGSEDARDYVCSCRDTVGEAFGASADCPTSSYIFLSIFPCIFCCLARGLQGLLDTRRSRHAEREEEQAKLELIRVYSYSSTQEEADALLRMLKANGSSQLELLRTLVPGCNTRAVEVKTFLTVQGLLPSRSYAYIARDLVKLVHQFAFGPLTLRQRKEPPVTPLGYLALHIPCPFNWLAGIRSAPEERDETQLHETLLGSARAF